MLFSLRSHALTLLLAMALTACGGSGGSDSSATGGQTPDPVNPPVDSDNPPADSGPDEPPAKVSLPESIVVAENSGIFLLAAQPGYEYQLGEGVAEQGLVTIADNGDLVLITGSSLQDEQGNQASIEIIVVETETGEASNHNVILDLQLFDQSAPVIVTDISAAFQVDENSEIGRASCRERVCMFV